MWRTVNLVGMIAFSFFLTRHFKKEVGLWISLSWFYYLARGLLQFQNLDGTGFGMPKELDQTMGQAFSQLLLIPLVILFIPQKYFEHWRKWLLVICLFDAFLLAVQNYGILNASSFDAGFLASTFSLVPLWAVGLFVLPILFVGHMATAVVVTASQLLTYGARNKKFTSMAILALLLFAAFYFHPGTHGFDSSGRVPAWIRFFTWWAQNANALIGTGTGSFQWLGPAIDGFLAGRKEGEIFMHMHNDWLQVLFEGGIIGFILVVGSYFNLLKRSWSRPMLFQAVIALGAFCLTYHPLRFFPSAVFICCLIREVVEEKEAAAIKLPRRFNL